MGTAKNAIVRLGMTIETEMVVVTETETMTATTGEMMNDVTAATGMDVVTGAKNMVVEGTDPVMTMIVVTAEMTERDSR